MYVCCIVHPCLFSKSMCFDPAVLTAVIQEVRSPQLPSNKVSEVVDDASWAGSTVVSVPVLRECHRAVRWA